MSKRVLVYDEVLKMLEQVKEQRLEDGWKRGASLEQIASEAIIFWMSRGNNEKFMDISDKEYILSHAGERSKDGE